MGWMTTAGTGVADFITGQITAGQQYKRQKKLMGIQQQNQQELMALQQQNQMALNEQGNQLQYDMWQKTNYPAQVGMLKEAGLNPALLYGKGGGGGTTTGSQGGGSAAGGSAAMGQVQQARSMDIMNNMMATANIELMKANADKARAEAENLRGIVTTEAETRIGKLIAETSNEKLKGDLIKVQTALTGIEASKTEEQMDASINNLKAQAAETNIRRELTEEQFTSLVKEAQGRVITQTIEQEFLRSKIKLTDTEKQAIITGITQKWTELSQKGETIDIERFKAEIAAEYPQAGAVIGGIAKKAYKSLQNIENALEGRGMQNIQDKVK